MSQLTQVVQDAHPAPPISVSSEPSSNPIRLPFPLLADCSNLVSRDDIFNHRRLASISSNASSSQGYQLSHRSSLFPVNFSTPVEWATPTNPTTLPAMEAPVESLSMRPPRRSLEGRDYTPALPRGSFQGASHTATSIMSIFSSELNHPEDTRKFSPLDNPRSSYSSEEHQASASLMDLRTSDSMSPLRSDHDQNEALANLSSVSRPRLGLETSFHRQSVYPKSANTYDTLCVNRLPPLELGVRTDFPRRSVHALEAERSYNTESRYGPVGSADQPHPTDLVEGMPQRLEQTQYEIAQQEQYSVRQSPRSIGPVRTERAPTQHNGPYERAELALYGCMFENEKDATFCKGKIDYPRKCTSQFFGRNKNETRLIAREAWSWACRKHYQRQNYGNKQTYWRAQLPLLIQQLDKFERVLGADIRFLIQGQSKLRKAIVLEDKRLADILRSGGVPPANTVRPSEELSDKMRKQVAWMARNKHLCGPNKTPEDVRHFFREAGAACEAGELKDLPDVEALMKKGGQRAKSPQ